MSLSVQQLNSDCTFLFAFSPASTTSDHPERFAGDFNILIDPWLAGQASVLHPLFHFTKHTDKPHITSLADLKQKLDLIIISQDKPDHCHRETLCTLPKNQHVNILTTPAAAKKIKSWNYFTEDIIHVIPAYDAKRDEKSAITIKVPARTSTSAEGEITITHLPPTRLDLTKVHNGIAITYRPPGNSFPNPQLHQSQTTTTDQDKTPATPTPTLSILFTPPGLPPATIQPWLITHLLPRTTATTNNPNANSNPQLPQTSKETPTLSLLLHSLSHDRNPTCLGGTVVHGAPGGLALLHSLRSLKPSFSVEHWIGAHDGPVERGGWSTWWLKSRSYGVQETQMWVDEEGFAGTRVSALGVGGVLKVP
jgi:hypothetical protein